MAFLQQEPASITLQTSKGTAIENCQIKEVSPFELKQAAAPTGLAIQRRCNVDPIYNCHGMTFASRRTGIHDINTITLILRDDAYREVERAHVIPGDVILYYSDEGELEHSGIVVSVPAQAQFWVPMVCSKWGKHGEFVHPGNSCPYNFANIRYYRIER